MHMKILIFMKQWLKKYGKINCNNNSIWLSTGTNKNYIVESYVNKLKLSIMQKHMSIKFYNQNIETKD